MLTATEEPRGGPPAAGGIADSWHTLSYRRFPWLLESCRGGFVGHCDFVRLREKIPGENASQ